MTRVSSRRRPGPPGSVLPDGQCVLGRFQPELICFGFDQRWTDFPWSVAFVVALIGPLSSLAYASKLSPYGIGPEAPNSYPGGPKARFVNRPIAPAHPLSFLPTRASRPVTNADFPVRVCDASPSVATRRTDARVGSANGFERGAPFSE